MSFEIDMLFDLKINIIDTHKKSNFDLHDSPIRQSAIHQSWLLKR